MSITFFPYLGHYFFKPEKKNTQVIRKWSHEKSICSEIPAHNELVYNLIIHCIAEYSWAECVWDFASEAVSQH